MNILDALHQVKAALRDCYDVVDTDHPQVQRGNWAMQAGAQVADAWQIIFDEFRERMGELPVLDESQTAQAPKHVVDEKDSGQ